MTQSNQNECRCQKKSCGCASVSTARCNCGENCPCQPVCRCGECGCSKSK